MSVCLSNCLSVSAVSLPFFPLFLYFFLSSFLYHPFLYPFCPQLPFSSSEWYVLSGNISKLLSSSESEYRRSLVSTLYGYSSSLVSTEETEKKIYLAFCGFISKIFFIKYIITPHSMILHIKCADILGLLIYVTE